MAQAGGSILAREEENNNEVRREDQDHINTFGRLNARLHEARETKERLQVRTGTVTEREALGQVEGIDSNAER